MKRKFTSIFIAGALISILSSCSTSMIVPVAVTDNPVGTKKGVAKATAIFGICTNCDVGAAKAAKNGKITKIATVDFKVKASFFKTTYETIVTGE